MPCGSPSARLSSPEANLHDPQDLRGLAHKCRMMTKPSLQPSVNEQLWLWAAELADYADETERCLKTGMHSSRETGYRPPQHWSSWTSSIGVADRGLKNRGRVAIPLDPTGREDQRERQRCQAGSTISTRTHWAAAGGSVYAAR